MKPAEPFEAVDQVTINLSEKSITYIFVVLALVIWLVSCCKARLCILSGIKETMLQTEQPSDELSFGTY